jgi:SMI1 / KNR4 family (SUKH-1)
MQRRKVSRDAEALRSGARLSDWNMLTPEILTERLTSAGIALLREIFPCSEDDIQLLEKEAGYRLPRSYRAFLEIAGRGAGDFMSDLTVYYPKIRGLTNRIRIKLDTILNLPPSTFVFMDRMGETFCYFELSASDDPPVYYWSEKTESVQKAFDSIWGFIESELQSAETIGRNQ